MKPIVCPHCKGTGQGHDGVRIFECFWCDGFGCIDEFTQPKNEEEV
jgi:RecJ-like exonuclease